MAENEYPLYLDGYLKDKHVWSEEKELDYGDEDGDKFIAKQCTICRAILRNNWIYYYACDISTSYPASDSPCLCTGRQYAEAHGLEYKPGKIYGYTDKKPRKPIDISELLA